MEPTDDMAIEVTLPSSDPSTYLQWVWLTREYASRILIRPFVAKEIERQTGTTVDSPVGRFAFAVMTHQLAEQANAALNAGQAWVSPRLWIEPAVLAVIGPFMGAHYRYLMRSTELRRFLCHGQDHSPEVEKLVDETTRSFALSASRHDYQLAYAS